MWVWTDEMLRRSMIRIMGSDTTTAAPLKNAVWGSVSAPLAPTHGSVIGDVTPSESGYRGYARVTGLTFTGPQITAEGGMEAIGPLISILGGDASASGIVRGEFLLTSDSVTLLGVNMFPAPISVLGTLVGGDDVPRTGITLAADKGSSIVSG
jgi:hypothetical protein